MQSIKALVATGAVVASTVGGAYAAGVVNKNGHEVNEHAAHGQSVAAAARAQHATPSASESATASAEPTETADPTETVQPTETASETATAAPTAAQHRGWTQGKHVGWSKNGKHYGVGHGKGEPAKPDHTKAPKPAHVPHQDAPTPGEVH